MTSPSWRQPPLRAVQHPLVHVLFGVTMALFARRAKVNIHVKAPDRSSCEEEPSA